MLRILTLLFLVPIFSHAQTLLHGKVIKIIDGDTFDLLNDQQELVRIRLLDIDSPERGQDYYKVAKQALADYIFGHVVYVEYVKRDRNKRILGRVYLNKRLINLMMVAEGYAWHFVKYSSDQRFAAAERKARKLQKGLWKGHKPIAPWDFRKNRREKTY